MFLTAEETLKSAKHIKLRVLNYRMLQLLTCIFSTIPIFSVLFINFVSRQDVLLPTDVKLTGINILASITNASLKVYSLGSVYNLIVPSYMVLVVVVYLVMQIAASILSLISEKSRKVSGYISLVAAMGIVAFFMLTMLLNDFTATDFSGNKMAFYKLFSFGLGFVIAVMFSVVAFITGSLIKKETVPLIKKYWFMYLLLLVPMILYLVFSFYPILLQTVLSFKDFKGSKGVWGSEWAGIKYFRMIFTDPDMLHIIMNTLYISFIRLIAGFLPPIILAVAIYEISHTRLKNAIQTITYLPHFFSWVIIYGISFAFLSPGGIVNNIMSLFHSAGIDFLTDENYFIPILVISAIWKELGWSTIIYIAALSAVDVSLYDASAVDGVGPLKKLWYITLPQIMPVIVFLTILAIGNILKGAGGEQILVFANSAVLNKANVIDTWVYWKGLAQMQYGLGAAVSFFQSGIGIIMVLAANKLSVKLVGRGLW